MVYYAAMAGEGHFGGSRLNTGSRDDSCAGGSSSRGAGSHGGRSGGRYIHSAYWYAKNYGWTHSDAPSYTLRYLDMYDCRVRMANGRFMHGMEAAMSGPMFNPIMFGVCIAMDIGVAMRREVAKIADPVEREKTKKALLREVQRLRRPFYYERETKRRRELAAERRRLHRRTTLAEEPTAEDVLAAWEQRKESKEAMVRLGGMLHDLECYVDNSLRLDCEGNVVGRNRGIRGWIAANLPQLTPKYKTLMRYKAMALKLRQATDTRDPKPTARLLTEEPRHEVVAEILTDPRPTFSALLDVLDRRLSPERVFDRPEPHNAVRRRPARRRKKKRRQ